MPRSVPSLGRVLVIAGFALSCFGLLLFLWLAFGGPVPFKPKGYQVKAAFPDAATLAEQADVRISGVTIGKVVRKDLAPEGNKSLATMQIDPEFAPLRTDVRAILRQKTLLGETYVELTPGSRRAPILADGARIRDAAVQPAVEFDELLRIFDPDTRKAFQEWQQTNARALRGGGPDLNDALANFGPFVEDARDVVDILDDRRTELRGLIRGTAGTFEAITRNEDALQSLIRDQRGVFEELATVRDDLAETFRILPTFQRESRATFTRVSEFSRETDPLLRELEPVLEDTRPTLQALRELSPDLIRVFRDLRPLIRAGNTGFPALSRVLRGLDPTLAQVGPFLQQLNPVLQYLEADMATVSDFLNTAPSAFGLKVPPPANSKTLGHALPQVTIFGEQTPPTENRTQDNRGNAYFAPGALVDPRIKQPQAFVLPSFDCRHVGGEKPPAEGDFGFPGCYLHEPFEFQGATRMFNAPREAGLAGTPRPEESR